MQIATRAQVHKLKYVLPVEEWLMFEHLYFLPYYAALICSFDLFS